jgi:hypothetical protein
MGLLLFQERAKHAEIPAKHGFYMAKFVEYPAKHVE